MDCYISKIFLLEIIRRNFRKASRSGELCELRFSLKKYKTQIVRKILALFKNMKLLLYTSVITCERNNLVNPLFIVFTFIWLGFLRKVLMANNNYHDLHKSLLRYTEDIRRNQHYTAFITAYLNLNEFPKGLKI